MVLAEHLILPLPFARVSLMRFQSSIWLGLLVVCGMTAQGNAQDAIQAVGKVQKVAGGFDFSVAAGTGGL